MTLLSKVLLASLFFFNMACSGADNYASSKAEASGELYDDVEMASYEEDLDMEADQAQSPKEKAQPIKRQIIKTGRVEMQVEDVEKTDTKIEEIVNSFNGFISRSNTNSTSYRKGSNYTVRVPFENFDPLMIALLGEGIFINNKSIEAQDVTEEYTDLEIRLQTKKEVRDRYIDILRNKAKTVKDVLQAEEQIRVIQEEIESAEGRLRYLKNRTSLATIHLNVYQEIEYVEEPNRYRDSFFGRLGRSFASGWRGVGNFFVGLVSIWPFLILLITIFLLRKRIWGLFR